MIIPLPDGKQIVVTQDKGRVWLQVCACRGSLGTEITRSEAIKVRAALMGAILEAEKDGDDPPGHEMSKRAR